MKLSISREPGKCFLNFHLTSSSVSRIAYPFDEECLERLVQAYVKEGVEVGDSPEMTLFISKEPERYFLDFYITKSTKHRVSYPFGKEPLRRLVQAYIQEGVDVANGNLEAKLFDYLTKK